MVVAVHGPELARGAGFRLPRLLRAVLVAAGLAALAWVLLALFGAGTASADSPPPNRSGSLLGDTVTDLTSTVDSVTEGVTGTVTGSASATVPVRAEHPVITTPGTVRGEASATKPVSVPAEAPRVVPVATPAAPKPVAAAKPAVVKRTQRAAAPIRHHVAARKAAPVVVKPLESPRPDNQANRPGPERAPTKVPLAPAMPTGSVSAGHDGPGTARGTLGVLPIAAIATPTEVCAAPDSERGIAGRGAGLPATSPD